MSGASKLRFGSCAWLAIPGGANGYRLSRLSRLSADGYRLTAKGLQIDLRYSKDDEWLALESPAKGGRINRYELT